MDRTRLLVAFTIGVHVAIAVGVGLVTVEDALLTTLGVVLLILGLMGLMPVARYWMDATPA